MRRHRRSQPQTTVKAKLTRWLRRLRPRGRPLFLIVGLLGPLLCLAFGFSYLYYSSVRLIDVRLRVERAGAAPRIFGRPLELRHGQAMSDRQLSDRLNELGYVQRGIAQESGEFQMGRDVLGLIPRDGPLAHRMVRVFFDTGPAVPDPGRIARIQLDRGPVMHIALGAPVISALPTGTREKRRLVPIASMPPRVIQAVLAIEDRRFFLHPGIDPIRAVSALVTNLRGDKSYLVGGSTITQQLVKNILLTPEKTLQRKLYEQLLAVLLERRLSKNAILELYLNEVYLGQRGSFAVHGVGEAARLFFGKDVSNVSLSEAATIAGTIQSPQAYSPFRAPNRARERRNVVLSAMSAAGFVSQDAAQRASREPLLVSTTGLESEAPYFVDFVSQTLERESAAALRSNRDVDVHTTLDLHLQRLAQEAVRDGLDLIDRKVQKRPGRHAEAALIAIDPATGEILALIGGRSYDRSQFNRAVSARRQPGSVFKPFVYLAAFERAAVDAQVRLSPATVVTDEPTSFSQGQRAWNPSNYGQEYDGPITLRRALARSRNIAAIKVAETTGYERVAALWEQMGGAARPQPYPSIALGVFEATPLEIARAYTVFSNAGRVRPLRSIRKIVAGDRDLTAASPPIQRVARPDTTFLVTDMMRSVMNDGTGSGAREAGFTLDAAGKSGTTNDLRDGWFVGFTPELLTVVWVGFDDNSPLGLSGTQAALPIWTAFMSKALAGHADRGFKPPPGVIYLEVDPETGGRASAVCPNHVREPFLVGAEPPPCGVHHF